MAVLVPWLPDPWIWVPLALTMLAAWGAAGSLSEARVRASTRGRAEL